MSNWPTAEHRTCSMHPAPVSPNSTTKRMCPRMCPASSKCAPNRALEAAQHALHAMHVLHVTRCDSWACVVSGYLARSCTNLGSLPHSPEAVGSNPTRPTIVKMSRNRHLGLFLLFFWVLAAIRGRLEQIDLSRILLAQAFRHSSLHPCGHPRLLQRCAEPRGLFRQRRRSACS